MAYSLWIKICAGSSIGGGEIMISIALLIAALVIMLLKMAGVVQNPIMVFLVVALIIVASSFVFKGKINCPFTQKCPFSICPLNKPSK